HDVHFLFLHQPISFVSTEGLQDMELTAQQVMHGVTDIGLIVHDQEAVLGSGHDARQTLRKRDSTALGRHAYPGVDNRDTDQSPASTWHYGSGEPRLGPHRGANDLDSERRRFGIYDCITRLASGHAGGGGGIEEFA